MTDAEMEERFRRLEEILAAIDRAIEAIEAHIYRPPTGNWSWKTPDEH